MKKLLWIIIIVALVLVFWAMRDAGSDGPEEAPVQNEPVTMEIAVPAELPQASATHTVDAAHSELSWSGGLVVGNRVHTGVVPVLSSQVWVSENMIEAAEIVFNMDALSSDNNTLTKDLRSKNFFETEIFPTATMEVTQLRLIGGGEYEAVGFLTVRGIRKSISVPVQISTDSGGFIVRGDTEVSRSQFGITFRSVGDNAIKDEMGLEFELVIGEKF